MFCHFKRQFQHILQSVSIKIAKPYLCLLVINLWLNWILFRCITIEGSGKKMQQISICTISNLNSLFYVMCMYYLLVSNPSYQTLKVNTQRYLFLQAYFETLSFLWFRQSLCIRGDITV